MFSKDLADFAGHLFMKLTLVIGGTTTCEIVRFKCEPGRFKNYFLRASLHDSLHDSLCRQLVVFRSLGLKKALYLC